MALVYRKSIIVGQDALNRARIEDQIQEVDDRPKTHWDTEAVFLALITGYLIGAALVPIVATSFGLPAVVLVGAAAYLVALPAFFSVLKPLQPQPMGAGRPATAGSAGRCWPGRS